MDADIAGTLVQVAQVVLLIVGLFSPVILFGGLIWLAVRHLQGRRTRFDGLFGGIGRAGAMNSHLQAATPHPDDLAVPVPPGPVRPRRTRRRRRRERA
jgi:hypothetical protein